MGTDYIFPKGPKYLYGTKYGFCSGNFPYGLGKYSPYGYLGPFGTGFLVSLQANVSGADLVINKTSTNNKGVWHPSRYWVKAMERVQLLEVTEAHPRS